MPRYTKKGYRKIARTMVRNKWPFGRQAKVGRKRARVDLVDRIQNKRLRRVESMIETKEGCQRTSTNLGLAHNNISVVGTSAGGDMNPIITQNGTGDPMDRTIGNRIGDQISVKGVLFKAFIENALGRSKVHYRILLIRAAKGDPINRSNLFKNNSDNKTIDQINTERYTVVASKKFTISAANAAASSTQLVTGAPVELLPGGTQFGGQGTRAISMWIPGKKFGRNGVIKYENASSSQAKFYDYRFVIFAYDWYGTAQDVNNVGILNEAYCKLYFKDA